MAETGADSILCQQSSGDIAGLDSMSGNGSNALILPVKKDKKKGHGKVSLRKNGTKEAPKFSNSKQRKLKQLEEEKEKKILLSKSIKALAKYKISDGAYSFMQSSGNMGQAETMREKRRRAVQFSKVGLEVPEDVLPFKKKREPQDSSDETAMKNNSDHSHLEYVNYNTTLLANCIVQHDSTKSQTVGGNLGSASESPPDNNTLSHVFMHPNLEPVKDEVDAFTAEDLGNQSSTLCSFGKRIDSNSQEVILSKTTSGLPSLSQDPGLHGSNSVQTNNGSSMRVMVRGHLNGPIIVHVSRPSEVEEKRKDLPIVMMEQEIMEAINEHSVVVICGETGCGKTTQVPQFLYEAGFGSKDYGDRKGIIGVTQPRRVAVLATAKRVSYELGLRLGEEVGFQVRHDKMIGNSCSVKFMTDGILLREVQSDFLLKRYSVIILDEAHERSLNTDVLVGMLSRIIGLRQKLYMEQQEKLLSGVKISPDNLITQLKLVLMSATLRVEDFISDRRLFHEIPPVLEVPVRQYPVTVHFSKKTKEDYLGQAFKKVMSIHKRLPPGGVLVFVTGQREVEFLCKKLRKASRQLTAKDSEVKKDENLILDVDMKEINDAFELSGSSSDQQTDRFSSYDDDLDNPTMHSYSSDSDLESWSEDDSEEEDCVKLEASEKSGLAVDFLEDPQNLSSLKAAFEALAGTSSEPDGKGKNNSPLASGTVACPEAAKKSPGALYVLPLYAMLPASAQLRVFAEVPEGERLVVVATNVAETSLTIPGIKYVVDSGKVKVKSYKYTSGMAAFEIQWISKASAAQRAGRAGRTGPGHCYRLYSSAAFGKNDLFPEYSCPEISKIPVDGVVLLMKFMGIDKVVNFPFPTPPETEALVEAEQCLKALEALNTQGRLTPIGKAMAQYPMSPRHSRMLLTFIQLMRNQLGYRRANFLLGFAVAAAAALSLPNPFIMQYQEISGAANDSDQEETANAEKSQKKIRKKARATAKEAQTRFRNLFSDALTVAYALQVFELADNPVSFCKNHALHLKTMEDMSKLRKQLLQLIFFQSNQCPEFSWNHGNIEEVELSWKKHHEKQPLLSNEEELLGQSICAGWADRVAKRVRAVTESSEKVSKMNVVWYQSCALKDTVFLHQWSSVSQMAPEFLVYNELLYTKRPYMHGVTTVKSDWLVRCASTLCTFSAPLSDPKPYYEPLNDCVLCWVSPTFGPHNWQLPLYSLPIKNEMLRISVFACALLEGHVLPCLKSMQKLLAAPPSMLLRPEALGHRRVVDLLNKLKLGSRLIESRARLKEVWDQKPQYLFLEIQRWFQEKYHGEFTELWKQMHQEVLLEGHELFPKRAKKDRKRSR